MSGKPQHISAVQRLQMRLMDSVNYKPPLKDITDALKAPGPIADWVGLLDTLGKERFIGIVPTIVKFKELIQSIMRRYNVAKIEGNEDAIKNIDQALKTFLKFGLHSYVAQRLDEPDSAIAGVFGVGVFGFTRAQKVMAANCLIERLDDNSVDLRHHKAALSNGTLNEYWTAIPGMSIDFSPGVSPGVSREP
ncbi:MAG: hypothetical protein Q7V63_03375 [Gammaproteobacteria bacterium]|nr:hypothetical protein [Gammaproteobacteria bacterium]